MSEYLTSYSLQRCRLRILRCYFCEISFKLLAALPLSEFVVSCVQIWSTPLKLVSNFANVLPWWSLPSAFSFPICCWLSFYVVRPCPRPSQIYACTAAPSFRTLFGVREPFDPTPTRSPSSFCSSFLLYTKFCLTCFPGLNWLAFRRFKFLRTACYPFAAPHYSYLVLVLKCDRICSYRDSQCYCASAPTRHSCPNWACWASHRMTSSSFAIAAVFPVVVFFSCLQLASQFARQLAPCNWWVLLCVSWVVRCEHSTF